MTTQIIQINKNENGKIQYLTEVLPMIPTNTILYKTLTGLGATYGELKTDRNSIIIEPNVPVIVGKCNDPKHKEDNLFGVYEGVYTEDVIKYLEKSADKRTKILTTPESFQKVKDAFELMDMDIYGTCFLLFDECHKIVKDADYRSDITRSMISSCSMKRLWYLRLPFLSVIHDSKCRNSKLSGSNLHLNINFLFH